MTSPRFRYDSYCGLYCGACDTLLANERDEVNKLAIKWKRKLKELICHGCKSASHAIFCQKCNIRKCAVSKKVDFCYQCKDYPCKLIIHFRYDNSPHHSVVLKNLAIIKQIGVSKWLARQKVRWSCSKCRRKFSWYDKMCRKCGNKLYNCEDEEKELVGE